MFHLDLFIIIIIIIYKCGHADKLRKQLGEEQSGQLLHKYKHSDLTLILKGCAVDAWMHDDELIICGEHFQNNTLHVYELRRTGGNWNHVVPGLRGSMLLNVQLNRRYRLRSPVCFLSPNVSNGEKNDKGRFERV